MEWNIPPSTIKWLINNDKYSLPFANGGLRIFTPQMVEDYLAWCETDEGGKWLKYDKEWEENHDKRRRNKNAPINSF